MRGALLLGLLAAGCSDGGAAATPRERMTREFLRAMKTLDLQYENLHEDLKAGRSPDEVRARLAPIRAAAEKAAALPYREAEAENRDLRFEFGKFLDAARSLEKAAWRGEDGVRAWKTLGAACASCHDLYREER
jgi:cytochrome c556